MCNCAKRREAIKNKVNAARERLKEMQNRWKAVRKPVKK